MSTIDIKNLVKHYGKTEVIHGIDLTIEDGEFIVVVGPSGCGKSTFLRMVAGLEEITGGDLMIGDKRMNDVEPKDRDIAMVFQNYALYPHMTVAENMGYGLKIRKTPKAEIQQRVAEAAEILQLGELLDRKPKQLSGGQRQRVAMGRAIVRHPKVFLFDEPLSNLDAKLRVEMRLEIEQLHKRLKNTCIYVTHDQIEAMTMADRIVIFNKGVAEQIGTPMDVYKTPQTKFVAGFIGSPEMNFIECAVQDGHVQLGETKVPFAGNQQQVSVGIRPEHIRRRSDELHPDAEITFTVQSVERLGADNYLYGQIPGVPIRLVSRVKGSWPVEPDDTKSMFVRLSDLHFFGEDGKRVTS